MCSGGIANWTIARAINTGTQFPRAYMGIHAGDPESYDTFIDIYKVPEIGDTAYDILMSNDILTALRRRVPSRIQVGPGACSQNRLGSHPSGRSRIQSRGTCSHCFHSDESSAQFGKTFHNESKWYGCVPHRRA
jgi:hypothetical protein